MRGRHPARWMAGSNRFPDEVQGVVWDTRFYSDPCHHRQNNLYNQQAGDHLVTAVVDTDYFHSHLHPVLNRTPGVVLENYRVAGSLALPTQLLSWSALQTFGSIHLAGPGSCAPFSVDLLTRLFVLSALPHFLLQ